MSTSSGLLTTVPKACPAYPLVGLSENQSYVRKSVLAPCLCWTSVLGPDSMRTSKPKPSVLMALVFFPQPQEARISIPSCVMVPKMSFFHSNLIVKQNELVILKEIIDYLPIKTLGS